MVTRSGIDAFAKAIATNWFAAMSGGFSFPLSIAGFYSDTESQQLFFVVTAILCILVAAYFVWRNERLDADKAKSLAETFSTPNFAMSFMFTHAILNQVDGPTIVITLALKNTGADSVILNWRLAHIDTKGNETVGELLTPIEDIKPLGGGVLKRSDYIIGRTAENPIVRGTQRIGHLSARFNGKSLLDLVEEGARYSISILDVFEKTTKFERINGPLTNPSLNKVVPGTESVLSKGVSLERVQKEEKKWMKQQARNEKKRAMTKAKQQ
ncbi:MAG: hypothetical protein ABL962_16100 [Fimbriimonadaceae bacterium]